MPYKDPILRREKAREYSRLWVERHPERAKEVQNNYRAKNPDKTRGWARDAYYKHKSEKQKEKRDQYHSHPEIQKWYALKTRSARIGLPFVMTREEFSRWWMSQDQKCTYCGLVDVTCDDKPFGGGQKSKFFSIDRCDSSLPYEVNNIVLACIRCNRLKSNFFTHNQWKEIAEKYIRPHWMKMLGVMNAA